MRAFDDSTNKLFNPNHLRFSLALKYFDESLSTLRQCWPRGSRGSMFSGDQVQSIGKLERL